MNEPYSRPLAPCELSARGIERQIRAFVRCATLAREAGYGGVEVMGSEGYFINQFLVTYTNHRTDECGGSHENRMRPPVEIVSRVREAIGRDFIIIFRLQMLDLIPDGSSQAEAVQLAKAIAGAGATIISTGIDWHETRRSSEAARELVARRGGAVVAAGRRRPPALRQDRSASSASNDSIAPLSGALPARGPP